MDVILEVYMDQRKFIFHEGKWIQMLGDSGQRLCLTKINTFSAIANLVEYVAIFITFGLVWLCKNVL